MSALVWHDGWGYRCPRCRLFVAIPQRDVPQYCPRCPAPEPAPATAVEEVSQDDAAECQRQLAGLSAWIDESNAHRDPEAVLWGRVAKLTEESGETIAALIGMTGQNPRKGVTHTADDVVAELLDVAITALGAVEHMTGNSGHALPALCAKVDAVHTRALDAR